jgi:hypothetical protein
MRVALIGKRGQAAAAFSAERHNRRARAAGIRFGLWIFPA